jgi:hypothetical protein
MHTSGTKEKKLRIWIVSFVILAILVACGEGSDSPTTPEVREVPAEAPTPAVEAPMGEAVGHFHPKGKPPSKHTIAVLEQSRSTLPFSDKRDFDEEKKGFLADDPDLSITINRSDLAQTMMGAKKLADQIADGTAKVEGDVEILGQLASTLVVFDPRFEIMPGTKGRATPEDLNDYEYGPSTSGASGCAQKESRESHAATRLGA